MLQYWSGYMNWPLDATWTCETCGDCVLIWGLMHGMCRCHTCHTQYMMRDGDERLTIPRNNLKPEYNQPATWGWAKWQRPISEWTDEMWDEAFAATATEAAKAEAAT